MGSGVEKDQQMTWQFIDGNWKMSWNFGNSYINHIVWRTGHVTTTFINLPLRTDLMME